tara:strand:+ start:16341 stop:17297 length:957 start_codon:yes stop_codon:yes gene_type:complete
MKTFHSSEFATLRSIQRPVHLAVGMFDGIHIGHQAVIHSAIQAAELDGGLCGLLTFDPHPSYLFRPEDPTPQIYPAILKEVLLREMGLDLCLIQSFTEKFSSHTAEEFVAHLTGILPTLSSISVGENFRFGKGRSGSPSLLVKTLSQKGISVFSCERVQLDGDPISSTRIRAILPRRPIQEVNRLLGKPYHSIGTVLRGKQLGRTIGFPTLNIPIDTEILPPFGVYLVRFRKNVEASGQPQFGVANFGLRPTVESSESPLLEIHSLEERPPDYGDIVVTEWLRFLRPEKKFSNVEELKRTIQSDKESALKLIEQFRTE